MSYLAKEELSQWWQVNRKSLPLVLIVPVLLIIGNFILLLQDSPEDEGFDKEGLLAVFEFLWIPLFTINMVYLGSKIGGRTALNFWWQMGIKLFFCLGGVLFATWMMEVIYAWNGIYDDDNIIIGEITFSPSASNFITNAVVAYTIAIPVFFTKERKKRFENKLQARQLEIQKLEKLQAISRLEALQAKLNPHFLYNALNTLTGLVYKDPAKAEQVILGLSELFRYNLRQNDEMLVSLEEELDTVKAYLSIEMIRFENMLHYDIEVTGDALKFMVPRFLLQPLVENAIKHGTSQITDGYIMIRLHADGSHNLSISIEDNGRPFPPDIEFGFGMSSTIEKLQLLFPERHQIKWENSPKKRVVINLQAPVHE